MKRLPALVLAFLCLAITGCVEGDVVYTVNPDGSAKVKMDVVTVTPLNLFTPGVPKKPVEETIDDVRRRAIRSTLESPGVAAWKDVSAEFLPNGKLKFSGIAYIKKLEDFDTKQGIPLIVPTLRAERGADGALKLAAKRTDGVGPSRRPAKSPEEIKKMPDEELDRHILLDLIDMQSTRPVLTAFFSDAKLKTTYILPGEVTATTGFARDGKTASFTLDGNKLIASFNKALNEDSAALRKRYRSATKAGAIQAEVFDFPADDASISVAKPGESLFDFDKEVQEARAAYPELRKKFGFGEDLRLPTSDTVPKK
jgi:hypothetical protein